MMMDSNLGFSDEINERLSPPVGSSRLKSSLEKFLDEAENLIELGHLNPVQLIYNELVSERSSEQNLSAALSFIEKTPFSSLKKKLISQRISSLNLSSSPSSNHTTFNLSNNKPSATNQHGSDDKYLESLVKSENLSHLVVNLYPNNEGFSVGIKIGGSSPLNDGDFSSDGGGNNGHTVSLSYEDDDLLDYLDNEELPPALVDLVESACDASHRLFYCGCIIAEVRDHRQSLSSSSYNHNHSESQFITLKPTNDTVMHDINRLTSSRSLGKVWSEEEKLSLEASLVNATAEPLCLDPSPLVGIISNNLSCQTDWLRSSHRIRRLSKRCSQRHKNRIKRNEALPAPRELSLCDFLAKRKNRSLASRRLNKNVNAYFVEKKHPDSIPFPKTIEVSKFAKQLEPPVHKTDNSLVKVEEFIMEFIEMERRSTYTCVSIFHRPIDDAYFGQLYVDRNRDCQNPAQGGSSCLFRLGTKESTKKYINQFTEILTENGRKSVKITHQRPGHQPQISYTAAFAQTMAAPQQQPKQVQVSKSDEAVILQKGLIAASAIKNDATHIQPSSSSASSSTVFVSAVGNHQNARPSGSSATMVLPNIVPAPSVTKAIQAKPIETQQQSQPQQIAVILTSSSMQTNISSHVPVTAASMPCESVVATTVGGTPIQMHQILPQPQHQQVQQQTIQLQPIAPANSRIVAQPLPTGVSLANLSLAPGQNLRLHNLVQLANVQGVSQSFIVPISLTMMPGTNNYVAELNHTYNTTNR